MSYDHWKTTNPQDEELESCPQPGQDDEPDQEELYWEHFGRYDEEPSEPDETSAEYQDRERNR